MTFTHRPRRRRVPFLSLSATAVCSSLLVACGTGPGPTEASSAPTTQGSTTPVEQRGATPRLVATYDGGLLVLDATSLETVADLPMDGYTRVNRAGDGRHVAVSTAGGFRLLDTGTWAEPHGDHAHHYTAPPRIVPGVIDARDPGHVVVHDGWTTFFDDGTGRVTAVRSAEVADPDAARRVVDSESPHHGVAVIGDDDEVILTLGDPETRTGVLARGPDGGELARSEACPGVHGEAAARDAIVFGCTDGALVYSGGEFARIDAPDDYGRSGNLAGSPDSPVVLADYKVEEDAEIERPTRVALLDTEAHTMRLVDLPSSYSFRSLARGPDGEALVLGTDGALHVIDPVSGEVTDSVDVVDPWTEPTEWTEPRPTLHVDGDRAYVTDPASAGLVAVDLAGLTVTAEAELPHPTDELTGVSGDAAPIA